MMMGFLAVVIMMGILVTFIILAMMKLKADIEGQMRKKADLVASKYDELLEEKSNELKELRKLKEEAENIIPVEFVQESMDYDHDDDYYFAKNVLYLDDSFPDNYRMVKQKFQAPARIAMLDIVEKLDREKKDFNVHEFKELLNLFDNDLQYAMLTLEEEEQLSVMEIVVQNSAAKKRILNRYIQARETFEFKEFLDYVKDYIFYNDATIYITANSTQARMRDAPSQVVFIEDDHLLEGYNIRFRDRLYDCSL